VSILSDMKRNDTVTFVIGYIILQWLDEIFFGLFCLIREDFPSPLCLFAGLLAGRFSLIARMEGSPSLPKPKS
jgi:hypothetical protein